MALARAKAEEIARKLKEREAASASQAPPPPPPPPMPPMPQQQQAAASLQAAALQEQIRRQMEQVGVVMFWGGAWLMDSWMCVFIYV